jgi:hypothetical protein
MIGSKRNPEPSLAQMRAPRYCGTPVRALRDSLRPIEHEIRYENYSSKCEREIGINASKRMSH